MKFIHLILAFLLFIALMHTNNATDTITPYDYGKEIKEITDKFKAGFSSIPSFYSKPSANNLDYLEKAVIEFETLKLDKILSQAVQNQDNNKLTSKEILIQLELENNVHPNLITSTIQHFKTNDLDSYLINSLESLTEDEQQALIIDMFSPAKKRVFPSGAFATYFLISISITSSLSFFQDITCFFYRLGLEKRKQKELHSDFENQRVSLKKLMKKLVMAKDKGMDYWCEVVEKGRSEKLVYKISNDLIPVKSQQLCALKLVLDYKEVNRQTILDFIESIPWKGNQEIINKINDVLNSDGKFQNINGYRDACFGLDKHKDSTQPNHLIPSTSQFDFKNPEDVKVLVDWIREGITKGLSEADTPLERLRDEFVSYQKHQDRSLT